MTDANPYSSQPPKSFWRSAVAEPGLYRMSDLWTPAFSLPANARFATYGSCFAQHISRALQTRDLNWVNAEPAPGKTSAALAAKYNYGVYSARTANIYTARALETWIELAEDPKLTKSIEIWQDGTRFRDSLRPLIEPDGFASREEAHTMLRSTAKACRRSIEDAEVLVFTMGLTEGFEHAETGQPYALCPGTVAGQFDVDLHVFRNYGFTEILASMNAAITGMRRINPEIKLLLTVSPVPLTATASQDHVLVATTYSKSVLRAVAGELARNDPSIDYFPSYEIISAPPARGQFFEPNMRSVSPYGVSLVMEHFFRGLDLSEPAKDHSPDPSVERRISAEKEMEAEDLACEELLLEDENAH
ncbi:GSCFA domain-containing protein [Primorskyibacter flagellatus]|uniref:GSCFA family protein n=1 Tax=Primorskyibacter flagellatus TaxID=1387277 RepID=A0A1W2E3A7_9RHOB|nr:GSCFA domain-containing protein [Primorskyibacter flagellatus]SMD04209.1 GSCFA family protein [Primorskyibacter flagellatus]